MRPDLDQYYLIDQYLENKLKGEELKAFEEQLQNDTSFAKEVKEQRMLNNLILEAELKGLRSQIAKDLANIQKPSFFRMNWQWIGAGLLALSGILYLITPSADNTNTAINQQSVTHSIENNIQSEIKATEKSVQITQPNNIQKKQQTTSSISALETDKAKDFSTTTNNTQSAQPNEAPPQITNTPVNVNPVPPVEIKTTDMIKAIDCSVTKITFAISTETSCQNSETGAIHIEKIAGGNAPYSYTLNNKKIKEKNISDLAAGTYEIKISDQNGCSVTQTATILEKNCTPAIKQGLKFNINPTIGETCSIPFDTDKKGNVTIYNRSGKIIYRATNPSTDYVEWTGTDGYGALADAGLYVYLIEYTDGTKVTGEVNIIR